MKEELQIGKKISKIIKRFSVIIDLLFMFLGLYLALWVNNWNSVRKDKQDAIIYLKEIHKELDDNIADINSNVKGHKLGIDACAIFEEYYLGNEVQLDFLTFYYSYLTRDFICVSNTSAYETLKSRGIQIITNDSLRFLISQVFNFRYENIIKLEEQYEESQFFKNYEKVIRESFEHFMRYNKEEKDDLESNTIETRKDSLITLLINSPCKEYNKDYWIQYDLEWLPNTNPQFLDDQIIWALRRIKYNRRFIIERYKKTLIDLEKLHAMIEDELILYDLN